MTHDVMESDWVGDDENKIYNYTCKHVTVS